MGRSYGALFLPNTTSAAVLQTVASFGASERLELQPAAHPNQVSLTKGSEAVNGVTRFLVTANDIPGGANVHIEVWMSTWLGEMDADPSVFVGILSRRKLYKRLKRLCAHLGVPGAEAAFRHTG